jgi:S-methylmethionine-dependent homocysteine/selenocysteine methylase
MKFSAAHGNEAHAGPLSRLLEERHPAILDGAMGTELARRGVDTGLPLWSANALLHSPETVRQIHADYIGAGADIITTDTFRTTRRMFLRSGLKDHSAESTALAVSLARDARDAHSGHCVLVAGSVAPLEDCYHPELVPSEAELRSEHAEHIQRLVSSGVDFLLLETMGTAREAQAAARAAAETGMEFALSFLCRHDGCLYSGEPLEEAVRRTEAHRPAAFLINCVSPRFIGNALEKLRTALGRRGAGKVTPTGLYGNVGTPGGEQGTPAGRGMDEDVGPEAYAAYALRWAALGASIIGGCCGTTPDHIRAVAAALRKRR